MARVSLAEYMKERRPESEQEDEKSGPFVCISRQYGCYGFSLGLLLLDILNEESESSWKIYHKEILETLATETNLATELIEREHMSKPRLIVDFFRSLSKERIPSGFEIRNRITTIIRGLALEGHAIIIGQAGSAATHDLKNGISIRLEAPEQWRVKQVAFREGISETKAALSIKEKEQQREYLRKIYEKRFPRKPSFNLLYDCSAFSLAQIAQSVEHIMKTTGLI